MDRPGDLCRAPVAERHLTFGWNLPSAPFSYSKMRNRAACGRTRPSSLKELKLPDWLLKFGGTPGASGPTKKKSFVLRSASPTRATPTAGMNSILSLDHRLPPCLSALDPGLAQLPRATVTPIKEGCEQQLWLAQMRRLCLAGDDRDRKRRGPALRASPQAASPGSPRAAILRRRGPRRRSSGSRRRGVRGRSGSGCGRRRSPCAEGADAQLVRRRHFDRRVARQHRDDARVLAIDLFRAVRVVKPSA
jgi:hypothetical protein